MANENKMIQVILGLLNHENLTEYEIKKRIVYCITEDGRKYFIEWLEDSKTSNSLKYEMLLKLFLGGAVDNAVSIDTITEFENEITQELSMLKIYKEKRSKVLNQRDHVFFLFDSFFWGRNICGALFLCLKAAIVIRRKRTHDESHVKNVTYGRCIGTHFIIILLMKETGGSQRGSLTISDIVSSFL